MPKNVISKKKTSSAHVIAQESRKQVIRKKRLSKVLNIFKLRIIDEQKKGL